MYFLPLLCFFSHCFPRASLEFKYIIIGLLVSSTPALPKFLSHFRRNISRYDFRVLCCITFKINALAKCSHRLMIGLMF